LLYKIQYIHTDTHTLGKHLKFTINNSTILILITKLKHYIYIYIYIYINILIAENAALHTQKHSLTHTQKDTVTNLHPAEQHILLHYP